MGSIALLTEPETRRLTELEAVIGRGLETFVEVGLALLEVRDSRLYRAQFKTFEAYCQERWSMTHRNADMTIQAAQVARVLGSALPVPTSVRQARELVPLLSEPEQLREVWEEIVADTDRPITASVIREAVKEKTKPEPDAVEDALAAMHGPAVMLAEFQQRLTNRAHQATKIVEFDPIEARSASDDITKSALNNAAQVWANWITKYNSAGGLRRVK